jgi:hypothetical protein
MYLRFRLVGDDEYVIGTWFCSSLTIFKAVSSRNLILILLWMIQICHAYVYMKDDQNY